MATLLPFGLDALAEAAAIPLTLYPDRRADADSRQGDHLSPSCGRRPGPGGAAYMDLSFAVRGRCGDIADGTWTLEELIEDDISVGTSPTAARAFWETGYEVMRTGTTSGTSSKGNSPTTRTTCASKGCNVSTHWGFEGRSHGCGPEMHGARTPKGYWAWQLLDDRGAFIHRNQSALNDEVRTRFLGHRMLTRSGIHSNPLLV